MMYLNDNQCECGHAKVQHYVDDRFTAQACTLNQRFCDCWVYRSRRRLSDHATTLILNLNGIKPNKIQGGD
jgi:hypothetical protein